ncbi:dTMP kinase [soil metagenome]
MLITFEGPEGAGKSTALASLAEMLREDGRDVVTTREPGAGSFGRQIRAILLEGDDIDVKAELLLFLADRANHVASLIRPALESGAVVLCDRFVDSTLVYQSFVRGLDRDFIVSANAFATGGLVPDLTVLFDLDPQIGLARLTSPDRMDRLPLEFHQQVRAGFLREFDADPARWIKIDASQDVLKVVTDLYAQVQKRIAS